MRDTPPSLSPRRAPRGVRPHAALLLGLAALPVGLSAQVSGSGHPGLSSLDQVVTNVLAAEAIPGATVAASEGGRLVFNKAYGRVSLATGQPMSTTTRSRIGSTSKILTALGVMRLTEQYPSFTTKKRLYGPTGVLGEPVWQNILAAYPLNHAVGNLIRVDHLLSHSSGFAGGGSLEGAAAYFSVPIQSLTYELVHAHFLLTHSLAFIPGSSSTYSNHNLGLGTLLIQRVSGQSYSTYIRNQITAPIGLMNTWPTGTVATSDPLFGIEATPHTYANGVPVVWSDATNPHPLEYAAGGWSSTARDLVRVMCATDKLTNRSDVLKPTTIDLMESRPYPDTAPGRAHGWQYEAPKGKLWHNGSVGGGASFIVKFPPGYISANGTDLSHVTVAICVNIQNAGPLGGLADQIALAVGAANIPASYDLF